MSEKRISVIRTTDHIEKYTVRNGYDWTIIFIDETNCAICCYGSYGSYCFSWPNHGTPSIKHFLCGIDFHYAMGKFLNGHGKWFDHEKTMERIKEYISIDTDISAERIAELLDDLEERCGSSTHEYEFTRELENTIFAQELVDATYEFIRHDFPPDAYGFWEEIWTPFIETLKVKISEEVPA